MTQSALLGAIASALLSLALVPTALAQGGAVWNSVDDGSLGTFSFTTSGISPGASIGSNNNLTTSNFSFRPLSAMQDCVSYAANDAWSIDFTTTVDGGVLWYGNFIRGGGAFPPGGSDVEYTFNHAPVIESGFGQGFITGNTLTVPDSNFNWGILSFAGPIDSLSCTTNATGISFQSMTFDEFLPIGPIGTNYCMANANSAGAIGQMSAVGRDQAVGGSVTLTASSLPNLSFGFFVTSRLRGFVANPGGSSGNLCLGGSIGRYIGPGQIQSTGLTGQLNLALDLTQIPSPIGFVPVVPGDTWNFQAWHRDIGTGSAASNLSDGLEIMFQ